MLNQLHFFFGVILRSALAEVFNRRIVVPTCKIVPDNPADSPRARHVTATVIRSVGPRGNFPRRTEQMWLGELADMKVEKVSKPQRPGPGVARRGKQTPPPWNLRAVRPARIIPASPVLLFLPSPSREITKERKQRIKEISHCGEGRGGWRQVPRS